MQRVVDRAERFLRRQSRLSGLDVQVVDDELHLYRGDAHFARLIPSEREGEWRMEYFHNLERWECIDFFGSLEECLEFLSDNPHYLFWEG